MKNNKPEILEVLFKRDVTGCWTVEIFHSDGYTDSHYYSEDLTLLDVMEKARDICKGDKNNDD